MDCPFIEDAGAYYRHRQATAHAQATLLGNLILCEVGNASMLWRLGVALMRAEQPSEGSVSSSRQIRATTTLSNIALWGSCEAEET